MATNQIPQITVEQRTHVGSRYAARLRDSGRLPAVIYGHHQEAVHVSMDTTQVTNLLHQRAHVLEVVHDSKAEPCLIKDVQWNHLGTAILHIDLTRVDLSEQVTTQVELVLTGEAVGLKTSGAIVTRPYATLEIVCQVANIPDQITADISAVDAGKPLTVADLELPEGVACALNPDTALVSIEIMAEAPEEEEEVTDVAEGEPEVITAKKEGEEETEAGDQQAKKE